MIKFYFRAPNNCNRAKKKPVKFHVPFKGVTFVSLVPINYPLQVLQNYISFLEKGIFIIALITLLDSAQSNTRKMIEQITLMKHLVSSGSFDARCAKIQRILQVLDCVGVLRFNHVGRYGTPNVPTASVVQKGVRIFEQGEGLEKVHTGESYVG